MEIQNTANTVVAVILSAILIAFILFGAVIVISALNSSNVQSGTVVSVTDNNTLTFSSVTTQPNTLTAPLKAVCSVTSVTNSTGGVVPTSNYSVNNCQITYIL